MPRVSIKPFRVAPPVDGGVIFMPPEITGLPWDMDVTLQVHATIAVDRGKMTAQCGLHEDTPLDVVVIAHSDTAYWTASGSLPVPPGGPHTIPLQLSVPSRTVADRLVLYRRVVLGADLDPVEGRVADRRGSILCDAPPHAVRLEGTDGQFPIDSVSFEHTNRSPSARWTVEYSYDSPEQPLLGAIRVLLNSAHAAVATLTEQTESLSEVQTLLGAELRRFVIADVLRQAVADEAFPSAQEWPDESLGHTANEFASRYCGTTIEELRSLGVIDRSRFEALLDGAVGGF